MTTTTLSRSILALGVFATALVFLNASPADALERSCKTVKKMNEELSCGLVSPQESDESAAPKREEKDFAMEHAFGPTECKVASAAKEASKEFKAECQTWLKERKADLKTKYQTGTCADRCEDCQISGVSAKTCSVIGVIHYAK